MAKGLNKVMLMGNLGADPDIKVSASGNTLGNFRIATSEIWKDKQSGENKEHTEWHTIVVFNRLAEICRDYLKKGARVYVEGSLRTRKWQDKNNQDRYTTEIVCSEMQMLDSKNHEEVNKKFESIKPSDVEKENLGESFSEST